MLLQALTVILALVGAGEGAPPQVLALVTAPWASHSELVQLADRGDGCGCRGAPVPADIWWLLLLAPLRRRRGGHARG